MEKKQRKKAVGSKKRMKIKKAAAGYLFASVSIVGLMAFYIVPFLRSVVQTVIKTDREGVRWIGFRSYTELFLYSIFGEALGNTIKLALAGLPLLLFFAICLTYFMNRLAVKKSGGVSFWFAVHLLPMILPSVVVATVVKLFFEKYGVINGILVNLGKEPVDWLNSQWACVMLCAIFLWNNTGDSMVVVFGGISGIEKEQLEAAALDGANERYTFFRIILPQLGIFFRFVLIMGIIGIFKLYRESYLLLGDSPTDEAYLIQNFLNNNFVSLNYDRTVIASVFLFLLIGTVLFFLFWFSEERHERKKKR